MARGGDTSDLSYRYLNAKFIPVASNVGRTKRIETSVNTQT